MNRALLISIGCFLLILVAVPLSCHRHRPSGTVVGSRSAENWWSGPAFYLLLDTEDGQREVGVTREEYNGYRYGETFPGD